jgi:hypothetical protein
MIETLQNAKSSKQKAGNWEPTCIDGSGDANMRPKSTKDIAAKGELLFRKLAPSYEREYGKYLAIDVDTEKAYLADSPQAALKIAQDKNPQGSFHLVKIGFEGLYRVASYGQSLTR